MLLLNGSYLTFCVQKKTMTRRRNVEIRRVILKTLEKRGAMTLTSIARETGTTVRATKRHLDALERFKGKVEAIHYHPKRKLYRLKN
jgi:predicted ArsR family transcriptional regulator